MPGVEIGENAVIGSNSLVNRSVPGGETWFGSPAKFYKKIDGR
jgi:acetyltransferase-like isoleucine patch superfamily enzyme